MAERDRGDDLAVIDQWFAHVTRYYRGWVFVDRDKLLLFLTEWVQHFKANCQDAARVCIAYGVAPDLLISAGRSAGVVAPSATLTITEDDLDACGDVVAKLKLIVEARAKDNGTSTANEGAEAKSRRGRPPGKTDETLEVESLFAEGVHDDDIVKRFPHLSGDPLRKKKERWLADGGAIVAQISDIK